MRDHTFLHRRFLLSIGLFQELATTPIKCQLMPLRESNLIHEGTTLCCIKKTNPLVKATFTIQDLNFKRILLPNASRIRWDCIGLRNNTEHICCCKKCQDKSGKSINGRYLFPLSLEDVSNVWDSHGLHKDSICF